MLNENHANIMTMNREAFITVLERATIERNGADELLQWGKRLLPILDRHPGWSLQQAVDCYDAERGEAP